MHLTYGNPARYKELCATQETITQQAMSKQFPPAPSSQKAQALCLLIDHKGEIDVRFVDEVLYSQLMTRSIRDR